MKNRKMAYIVIISVVCVLLIAAGLYFVPIKSTPIDITMEAVKSDSDENEIGTVPITVKGTVEKYLFRDDRVSLKIESFEDLYDIKQWDSRDYSGYGPDEYGFYWLYFNASSTVAGENSYMVTVIFREDLSSWEFFRVCRKYHYVEETEELILEEYPELDIRYRATVE